MRPSIKKFLKRNITEQENIFFNEINRITAINQRTKVENYSWKSKSYKIYPSSISSLFMCPKSYIEEGVHEPNNVPLEVAYKGDVGHAVHGLLQTKLVEYEGSILYDRPKNLGPILEEKMKNSWPEVPLWEESSGLSGRCDIVIRKNDAPAIVDIKTKSVGLERWEKFKETLPLAKDVMQIRVYRHIFNSQNYWDKKVREVCLAYLNVCIPPGDPNAEVECWIDLGEDEDIEIKNLIEHLSKHRTAWLSLEGEILGRDTGECTYSKCGVHTK